MIAADTSTWIAYFQGKPGEDTEFLDRALANRQVVMPPAVLTELLSDPKLAPSTARMLCEVPRVELLPGYWERAGRLRAKAKGRKARLGDALIAQSCRDNGVELLTRDKDYRIFAQL